jgi:hypothetical protein
VSYGLPVGHAKLNTRLMAQHELLLLAEDPRELVESVERGCREAARPPAAVSRGAALDAASAVLTAHRRIRPLAAWRMRVARIGAAVLMSLGVGFWVMSTDEVAAFASVLGIHPVKTLKTDRPAVDLLISAPAGTLTTVAARLGRDGLEASIATPAPLAARTMRSLRANGDVPIPTLRHAGLFGWIRTSSRLRHEARALHLHRHFYYLEPHNPSLGELLLARAAGGLPVRGSVSLSTKAELPARPLRPGDVVVVSLNGSSASLRALDRLEALLQSDGLIGLPLLAPAG